MESNKKKQRIIINNTGDKLSIVMPYRRSVFSYLFITLLIIIICNEFYQLIIGEKYFGFSEIFGLFILAFIFKKIVFRTPETLSIDRKEIFYDSGNPPIIANYSDRYAMRERYNVPPLLKQVHWEWILRSVWSVRKTLPVKEINSLKLTDFHSTRNVLTIDGDFQICMSLDYNEKKKVYAEILKFTDEF